MLYNSSKKADLHNNFLVPFDAQALYTNISLQLAVESITFYSEKYSVLIPERLRESEFLKEAITHLFSENFFVFNGSIFKQKDGLSMGCNCAVNLAELCLSYLEIKHNFDSKIYRRYIDDSIVQIPKKDAKNAIKSFLEKLNSLNENINWTVDFDLKNPKTVFLIFW